MIPRVEAVTFDFFGTLVFHRGGRGRGRLVMEYLERQGFAPTPWDHSVLYDVFAGHGDLYSPHAADADRTAYYCELARRVFDRLGILASPATAQNHAEALWHLLGPRSFSVFPDAWEVLHALRARRVPVAVVSNWQSGLEHFCTELGLGDFIDHVCSSADVGAEKPHPRIFREAAARLGVPPERTLHVGDTYLDDYLGGASAGFQVALIDRGGRPATPADRVAPTLTVVLDLITGASGADPG